MKGLLSFPSLLSLAHTLPVISFHDLPLLIKPSIKTPRCTHFFLTKPPTSCKTQCKCFRNNMAAPWLAHRLLRLVARSTQSQMADHQVRWPRCNGRRVHLFPLRSRPTSSQRPFCSHLFGQILVTWPYLAAGRVGNVLCPAKTLRLRCKRKEGSVGWLRAESAAKVAVCFEAY